MYEVEFIKKLNFEGKHKVSTLLNNMFRYQDDCLVLNDSTQFSRHYNSIYPNEMVLENTNVNTVESNYLDLNITLSNGTFSYKSYDKREDYTFEVIRYPICLETSHSSPHMVYSCPNVNVLQKLTA